MNRIFVFVIVLSGLALAQLDFSNPVRCPGQISEWWRDPAGCIGPGNELYAAWTHTGLGSGDGGIYFARSLDTNQTWSSQITIHFWDPTWIHAEYRSAELRAVGDTVYNIYWLRPEHANNQYHVYCSRSDDRGATWNIFEASISGDCSGSLSGHDFVADENGNVSLVYANSPALLSWTRTFFARSTNGGVTFTTPVMLPSDTSYLGADRPSIVVLDDGALLVANRHARGEETYLMLSRSDDDGVTWDTTRLTSLGLGRYPTLRRGRLAEDLHLFFEGSNDELKYARSTDAGETWTAPFTLVSDNYASAFAACDDRLLALWTDANSWEAWHRASGDGGQGWSEAKKVWLSNPFPGDWLSFTPDIRNDMAAFWCHPEPGNNEATWCADAVWQTGVAESDPGARPTLPPLRACPNPFTGSTWLGGPSEAVGLPVSVYNSSGRLVGELDLSTNPAWDGSDAYGNRLPAGVYVCKAHGCSPLRLVLSD